MSRRTRGWVILGVISLFLSVATFFLSGDGLHPERKPISNALIWARLQPFPQSSRDLAVEIVRSNFTHEFRIHFKAPIADIRKWLEASPGTKEARIERNGKWARYQIEPAGGAQFAEVNVDEESESVEVHVFRS